MAREFRDYEDFFPYYVGEHSRPATRWVHFAGTHLGALVALTGIATRRPRLVPLFPVIAYGFAWTSHFLIEKNKPATFGHPLWSLRGDLQMITTMWRGRDAELTETARRVRERSGVDSPAVDRPILVPAPGQEPVAAG